MSMDLTQHFCVVPFVHFSCKPDGSPRVCCFSQNSYVLNDDGKRSHLTHQSIDEIWHSKWMNSFREKMFFNEAPSECKFCHNEEAAGKTSKRQSENRKYLETSQEIIACAKKQNGKINSPPVYFDLRLGNLCNLKCRTCNPLFSSAWAREVEAHPTNAILQSYQSTLDQARQSESWHKSPDFWNQFHSIAGSIEEIYLTGGEPMLIKEHFALLKFFKENDYAKNIYLRYNTNLTLLPDEFLQLAPNFKKISLSCSIDGLREKNDWLRSPSKWSMIEENFNKTLLLPSNVNIDINCTVSIFNVLYFDELFLYFKNIAKESGRMIEVFPDILHEPLFMPLHLLPSDLKLVAQDRLLGLLERSDLTNSERKNILSLNRMLNVQNAHQADLLNQLKNHIVALDKIRQEKFELVFPELAQLIVEHQ